MSLGRDERARRLQLRERNKAGAGEPRVFDGQRGGIRRGIEQCNFQSAFCGSRVRTATPGRFVMKAHVNSTFLADGNNFRVGTM